MGLLFPGFLLGALAIGLPIALHLLRRWPRRPVVFPSLRFLSPSSVRTERTSQRLQRWLVLALRCAVLLLLALAFCRPFRHGLAGRQSRAVVVVIDNSFSLQTKGRWEALRHWAIQTCGTFGPGDKLGLLLMGPQPNWLVAPTMETGPAMQTLAGLQPGWLSVRVEPALRLAADAVAAIPADRREVIVLCDHRRLSWSGTDFSEQLPPGVAVSFPDPPSPAGKQASLGLPVLAKTDHGIAATVAIHNFTGAQQRTLRVYASTPESLRPYPVALRGSAGSRSSPSGLQMPLREDVALRGSAGIAPLREETINLAAHETRSLKLNLPADPDKTAYFQFTLDGDDLPADDTAYAIWQPSSDGSLLLDAAPEGSSADFVAEALEASAGVEPMLQVKMLPNGPWPSRSIAILRNDDSFAGTSGVRLTNFINNGGSALIFATAGPAESKWLSAHGMAISPRPEGEEPQSLGDWTLTHPLVASLSKNRLDVLLGWEFSGGWILASDATEPLARWPEGGTAMGEAHIGSGVLLLCGFMPNRQEGDWPLAPSFVPFLHEAGAYLLSAQERTATSARTGQTVPLSGAPGRWRGIDGPATAEPAIDAAGSVVPMAPGIYEFMQGKTRTLVAVNVPEEGSDPAIWTEGKPWLGLVSHKPAPKAKVPPVRLADVDAEQHGAFWWWVLVAAAILLLAELAVANRTSR